jgi:DNA-binding transcriptional ArsR family regulator
MTAGAPRKELGPQINPWRLFQGSFIPNAVMQLPRRRLSSDAKTCYGRLLQFAGKRGVAFPWVGQLAIEIGQSRRSAERALQQLRTAGLITTVKRGRGKRSLIHFHLPADIFGDVCPRVNPPPVAGQSPGWPATRGGSRVGASIERARAVNLNQLKPKNHRSAEGRPVGRGAVFTERGNPRGQQRVAGLLAGIVKRT